MQHLQTKHGKLLHGKQKLFSVHLEQFGIAEGRGGPEAAMVWINQCSYPKTTTGAKGFNILSHPAELNGS